MKVAWPVAGSLPEFVLRLRVYQQSDSGSSTDEYGVTGGVRCRECC